MTLIRIIGVGILIGIVASLASIICKVLYRRWSETLKLHSGEIVGKVKSVRRRWEPGEDPKEEAAEDKEEAAEDKEEAAEDKEEAAEDKEEAAEDKDRETI